METFRSVSRIQSNGIAVGNLIGQGTFGTVIKSEWLSTPVAIRKILVKRMKILEKSLHRELQIRSRMRHPNIVQLVAYSTENKSLYFVQYIHTPLRNRFGLRKRCCRS